MLAGEYFSVIEAEDVVVGGVAVVTAVALVDLVVFPGALWAI